MLNHVRSLAGVPRQGTEMVQIFAPQLTTIALRRAAAGQGIMDDTGQHRYHFDYGSMTESSWAKLKPLPLFVGGAWGKEPN
jgi:hypothetical protein